MGINVVDVKLSISCSVEGPGAVIAHDSPGTIRCGGGGLSGLGGLVSGGMCGAITNIIKPVSCYITSHRHICFSVSFLGLGVTWPVANLEIWVEGSARGTEELLNCPASSSIRNTSEVMR